jgi:beta-N-acetylhexosaminidase
MPAIDAGEDSFGHSGYTGTFTWADPNTGILFVFMSNRVYPTRANNKIAELSIRPQMHQVIYDARN